MKKSLKQIKPSLPLLLSSAAIERVSGGGDLRAKSDTLSFEIHELDWGFKR